MPDWPTELLERIADIRPSNVDKKSNPGEKPVRLCNYMDVYSHDYIGANIEFMNATATAPEIQRFQVEAGDVLITKDSETPDDIGVPAVVSDDIPKLICGYHVALIKPNREKVDPVFLAKQLAFADTARHYGRVANGSTRYSLSYQSIAKTPIRLAPLPQQQRIAEILSTVDAAIEQTEALIAKTQQIKAGLMHDLLTRGVTAEGQIRPPRDEAPQLYKESPLGWIPKEWKTGHLGDRRAPNQPPIKTGPFGSSLKLEHWVEQGVPVITIGALGEGQFILYQLLHVSEQTAERLREYRLNDGDVVFSRVADVGRSAVITRAERGWVMSSNLMRITLDAARVVPAFLQAQLAHDSRVRGQIRSTVNAGGRDVANGRILSRLWFCWPKREEQERIVARFEALDGERRCTLKELEKLRQQKIGLMQDLLTGRVFVNGESTRQTDAGVVIEDV